MSASDAVLLIWLAILATHYQRTMHRLKQEAKRAHEPSAFDTACASAYAKLIETERYTGRQKRLTVLSSQSLTIKGERFKLTLERER